MKERINKWINKNKNDFFGLLFILGIGALSRMYKIGEYMTFLGDEGRDAIIVRRLLVHFDPILIGPGTSIGNMYLGPLYYYLSAPFLLLANFSPVGPSIMVALFGVATIFFIWHIANIWFGRKAAFVSALLYAISPVVIIYNRSSWNPNIMPFFALLTVFSLWKVWGEEKYKWFILLGISFAFVLQSHYLGLLLIPIIIFFIAIEFRRLRIGGVRVSVTKDTKNERVTQDLLTLKRSNFLKNILIGFIVFCLLMSPLLIFDLRHNFINFNAVKTFFTERQTTVSIKPWKSLPNIYPILRDNISYRIISGSNLLAGKITINIMLVTFFSFILFNLLKFKRALLQNDKKDIFLKGFLMLTVWIVVGLVGLGLYKQHVYDHYFGFLYPAFYLFIGAVYQKIIDMHFDGLKIIITAWIIILIGSYVVNSPLRGSPNFQMKRAQEVAAVIQKDVGYSKFNLAVIAERNYEDGYQYFLEKDGANVIDIDALRLEETIGEHLYVICEIPLEKCDPVNSPKAEVANFGWSKVVGKWSRDGITIFKLAHTE